MANERRSILVALGMGLLAGLLATLGVVLFSSSMAVAADESTPDLLPGVDLVTEEVEPGVYRVLSDSVRDLSRLPLRSMNLSNDTTIDSAIAAGPDGTVWMSMPEGSFYVGDSHTSAGDAAAIQTTLELGSDGRVWRALTYPLGFYSEESDSWVTMEGFERTANRRAALGVEVTPDGSVWAQVVCPQNGCQNELEVVRIAGIDQTTIRVPKKFARPYPIGINWGQSFAVSADGDIWMHTFTDEPQRPGTLTHYDGEMWQLVDPTGMATSIRTGPFDLGSDDTLWAYFRGTEPTADDERPPGVLARLRDGSWTTFAEADGVPPMIDMYQGSAGFLRAASDGSVWLTPQPRQERVGVRWTECDGVARFDGADWTHYLPGYCVYAFDVAANGAVWLHGQPEPGDQDSEAQPIDTFVITPEAVAEAE